MSDAILQMPGVISFDLTMTDHPTPDKCHMAVMGTATFAKRYRPRRRVSHALLAAARRLRVIAAVLTAPPRLRATEALLTAARRLRVIAAFLRAARRLRVADAFLAAARRLRALAFTAGAISLVPSSPDPPIVSRRIGKDNANH